MTSLLLWLDDPACTDAARVGPKAARLAFLRQAGLPVPNAFVLTAEALLAALPPELEAALLSAYRTLVADGAPVAVRSSATAEDMEDASFAGLQQSVLNVQGEAALLDAVRQVWGSLASPEARAYRARMGVEGAAMAVLVQQQVAARVAGIAFARDPITDEEVMVVEAVAGLGDVLASGEAEPQRWRLVGREIQGAAPPEPLLDEAQLRELAARVAAVSRTFGAPQDVEWAWDERRLWLLQSRPITTRREDWFTHHLPDDDFLWTAAFLNERFTQPLSPLGWNLVAQPLERLALRGPLELLGVRGVEGPLLKLWRGHPYSRVDAWQRIYKLFPDPLLPEDASRYFPEGDVSLRHAPRQPTLGPHLLASALRLLRGSFHAVSPLHNPQAWARYEQRQAAALIRFRFEERQLARAPEPIAAGRALLRQVATLTDELLDLHRWSLLYAEFFYSLLRRLLVLRYGRERGAEMAVHLTAHVETVTSRMNGELQALAAQVTQQAGAEGSDWPERVAAHPALQAAVEDFLAKYGHRSFTLDLLEAPWEADVPAFVSFLATLTPRAERPAARASTRATLRPDASFHWLLAPLLQLTRAYLKLREAQRFHWQQLLALQRRVVLRMGQEWAACGKLDVAEDVFGMTWDALMEGEPERERVAARLAHLRRLRAQSRQAPGWHHPDFLRGNIPIRTTAQGTELAGRAVSPGIARGPARLIAHPGDFERLRAGDILVTTSPDPGWTPIFGTVAGMVTERGGQLSHGAVVAREYALPAVSGIAGALSLIQEGEILLVDGTQGVVVREDQ